MTDPAVNSFDAIVCFLLIVAVIMGFRSGLLRSVATILGYLVAMPIAVTAAPKLSLILASQFKIAAAQLLVVFFGILLLVGAALSAVFRIAVNEIVGPTVSLPDRVAGAALGAVRIGLLAVVMVLIFDRIIPPQLEVPFLKDSRLKPILSAAGQQGLKALPPDVIAYIDQLKRDKGL